MKVCMGVCVAWLALDGSACGGPQAATGVAEAEVVACLATLMQHLDEPPGDDAVPGTVRVSCAVPYGTKACAAAWLAARNAMMAASQDADVAFVAPEGAAATDAAIQICAPPLCASLADPRPRLCETPSMGGFGGYIAWQELHRVVLERELGHARAMGILGFLAGVMRPAR